MALCYLAIWLALDVKASTIRQKINGEMEDVNSSLVEMHLVDLYRQFHATEVEYTFLNTEKTLQDRSHDG